MSESQKNPINWRAVRMWLKLPFYLIIKLVSFIFNLVQNIHFKYDQLSAIIDTGSSSSSSTMKDEITLLSLGDITNKKLRKTLKWFIFNKWYVYSIDRQNYEGRAPIYISHDKLKTGDKINAERLSDRLINKDYKNSTNRKFLKKKGVSDFSELEPQYYVIATLETKNHQERSDVRKIRYEHKQKLKLEKEVKKHIKDDDVLGRSRFGFTDEPIAFKAVKENRIDLLQQLIDNCFDDEELYLLLQQKVDDDGWRVRRQDFTSTYYIGLLDVVKTDEMKDFINQEIEKIDEMKLNEK